MKKNLFQKRIPTVFAFIILISGLFVTAFLVQIGVFKSSQATPNEKPQNVSISNITNSSFTVTFTTLDPTLSAVQINNPDSPSVVFDVRDAQGNQSYINHFITVTNLKPNTQYKFTLLSNGDEYTDNGTFYTTTTADGDAPSSGNTYALSGKVILPNGENANDVLLDIKIPNAAPISAVTNSEGKYSIPTYLIRNTSHDQILTLVPNTHISLSAKKGDLTSDILYTYSPSTEIPTITLSSNYSFIASTDEENLSSQSSLLAIPTGKKTAQILIISPRNGQTYTDEKPQFKGTAFPNSLIALSTEPDLINVQVRTDPNGNWAYRPAVSLTQGAYTIKLQAADANGATKTVASSFTILASGSQIAEDATPSAKPTPTQVLAPTPTVTALPTINLTTTPTPTSSSTPTLAPTQTPIPTATAITPTSPPPLPPTGSVSQSIFLTSISILFIVSGSILLLIL
ncbi:MAG TPA: Ig-like domain-containing protein [Candidatus Levybacteria bacterium]|nr:Ig-like domain-containing protein [Candidatus Levybacteria bacterium]